MCYNTFIIVYNWKPFIKTVRSSVKKLCCPSYDKKYFCQKKNVLQLFKINKFLVIVQRDIISAVQTTLQRSKNAKPYLTGRLQDYH